jgi:arylsulfatase A-like enzyme
MFKIRVFRVLLVLAPLLLPAGCRERTDPSERVHTTLDLIDLFPRAVEKAGRVSANEMYCKGGKLRSVIRMSPGDRITFDVFIHHKASLNFKWGIKKAPPRGKKNRKGVIQITISDEKKERLLFSREIPADDTTDCEQWREEKISLADFSGRRAALSFSMAGNARMDWGLANPMIRSGGKMPGRRAEPDGPNVILVSVDTLRADHLHCYGYDGQTSPTIDRLAAEGVLFERAYAQAHWTLPSHLSLLTSLYPDVHRVPSKEAPALDDRIPTLASIMKEKGYLTAGFAKDCGYMSPSYGLNAGFDRYSMRHQDAEGYNRRVERWLEDTAGKKFFLFLHFFDPHSDARILPYEGPEAYMAAFTEGVESDFSGCRNGVCGSLFLDSVNKGINQIRPDELAYIRALYNAGIREADDHLAFLLDTMEKLGLTDNTILVFSSDHGEEFMEHGRLLHTQFYEELIHVPLIFHYPGGGLPPGKRVRSLVENIDIFPTILDLLDIRYEGPIQGRSLVPSFKGERPPEKIVYGAAVSVPRQIVRSGPWKLILGQENKTELFNLDRDPGERTNCVETEQDICARLLAIADERREAHVDLFQALTLKKKKPKPPAKPALSQAEEAHLRALGYIQ